MNPLTTSLTCELTSHIVSLDTNCVLLNHKAVWKRRNHPQPQHPKKKTCFADQIFMGPWIQKKNTPHTTFGGLWGQNSLSFQTNVSWAAHQNHFNKLRNVSWEMEMSRSSFSKMGILLRVVVTSQSACQKLDPKWVPERAKHSGRKI